MGNSASFYRRGTRKLGENIYILKYIWYVFLNKFFLCVLFYNILAGRAVRFLDRVAIASLMVFESQDFSMVPEAGERTEWP